VRPRLGPRGPFATLHWRGTKILETTECGRRPPMLSDALYGLAHVCDQHLTKSSPARLIASHGAGNAGIVSKLCRRVYKKEKRFRGLVSTNR
jgi:hypothetical protein